MLIFRSYSLSWPLLASFLDLLASTVVAQDNPYQVVYHWGELPGGRPMGIVTGVQPDPDGEHLWII